MRFGRFLLGSALVFTTSMPSLAKSSHHHSSSHKHSKSTKVKGQRSIDDARATQIQTALVKSGYLTDAKASGHWDAATESAMQKFQSDNGWQTKLTPDSRAIIKLGLGPSHDSAEVAATTSTSSASHPANITSSSTPSSSFLQK